MVAVGHLIESGSMTSQEVTKNGDSIGGMDEMGGR